MYTSTVSVYDLQNPSAPRALGTATSERLKPAYGYGYDDEGDIDYCGDFYGYYYDDFTRVLESGTVVFANTVPQQRVLAEERVCTEWANERSDCFGGDGDTGDGDGDIGDGDGDGDAPPVDEADGDTQQDAGTAAPTPLPVPKQDCVYYTGTIECRNKSGEEPVCTGGMKRCTEQADGSSCVPVDASTISTSRECRWERRRRFWSSLRLEVLDLRNPAQPTFKTVAFSDDDEFEGLVTAQDSVYPAYKRPIALASDTRGYAKYFFRKVDLTNPSAPAVGSEVNVPGELVAVVGDDYYTRDLRWDEQHWDAAETWLHWVTVSAGVASIRASEHFDNRYVQGLVSDGQGHLLVNHQGVYWSGDSDYASRLNVYDAKLTRLSSTVIDDWATLNQAVEGRALYSVPGGFLVLNLEDPAKPRAQAYFPHNGYMEDVEFDGTRAMVASGRYGIQVFDATTENLLTP